MAAFRCAKAVMNCVACGEKGRGAIDLVMQARKCGSTDSVQLLEAPSQLQRERRPQRRRTEFPEADTQPSENPPFKSSYSFYSKFRTEPEWLAKRGLPRDIELLRVFQYTNPARKSLAPKTARVLANGMRRRSSRTRHRGTREILSNVEPLKL